MTPAKRAMDLVLVCLMLPFALPVLGVVAMFILILDGKPIFFVSERMRDADRGFSLIKFRTMVSSQGRQGVTGGDKSSAITRSGQFLRRTHLDEVPQLMNVLRGDLSLVGPRPPLRMYVEAAPELYREVLKSRPGITGLATLLYGPHEARLLAKCSYADITHATYLRRCVPAKGRIDLIYAKNQTVCWDLLILVRTIWASLVN